MTKLIIGGLAAGALALGGSWMRERIIGIPAHYEPASSDGSSGSYYSHCTYSPGGWVAAQIDDDETYSVRPDTVLPDEPGHMPNPAPAAAPQGGPLA